MVAQKYIPSSWPKCTRDRVRRRECLPVIGPDDGNACPLLGPTTEMIAHYRADDCPLSCPTGQYLCVKCEYQPDSDVHVSIIIDRTWYNVCLWADLAAITTL